MLQGSDPIIVLKFGFRKKNSYLDIQNEEKLLNTILNWLQIRITYLEF